MVTDSIFQNKIDPNGVYLMDTSFIGFTFE